MKDKLRGYNSSQLYREDPILRLQHLNAELKVGLQKIKKLECKVEEGDAPE